MKLTRLVVVLIFLASCGEDKEIVCDNYFLSENTFAGTVTKFYYNTDSKLSKEVGVSSAGTITTNYMYDATRKLKEVVITNGATEIFRIRFYFNNGGQLSSMVRTQHNDVLDSVVVNYNSNGKVSSTDTYPGGLENRYSYKNYIYPDASTVTVEFYSAPGGDPTKPFVYTGTFEYTVDNKPRPFPAERDFVWAAFTNSILTNNYVSLKTYGGLGAPIDTQVTITYNAAGYPLSDGSTYVYLCEPPKE